MKLSVIVPIRNGEKFLVQCIESILKQTFNDFELILVNNKSEDRSQEIIDKFANIDSRVISVKANGLKVNAVRKLGLEYSKGEYISFVDCDDWIEENMFKVLVEYCDRNILDMVTSGAIREYVEKNEQEEIMDTIPEGVYNKEKMKLEVYPIMLYREPFYTYGIQPSLWNKLFKRDLLVKVYDKLDTNIIYGEDATVVYKALLISNRIGVLQKGFYHYRIHSSSNTYQVLPEFLSSSFLLYSQLKQIFEENEQHDALIKQLEMFMISTAFFNLNRVFNIDIYSMSKWHMPFAKKLKNKKVSIYGAGDVGQCFYERIKKDATIKMGYWVDANFNSLPEEVNDPIKLKENRSDYVIIAIFDRNVAKIVTDVLLDYGYDLEQILWKKYEKKWPF